MVEEAVLIRPTGSESALEMSGNSDVSIVRTPKIAAYTAILAMMIGTRSFMRGVNPFSSTSAEAC